MSFPTKMIHPVDGTLELSGKVLALLRKEHTLKVFNKTKIFPRLCFVAVYPHKELNKNILSFISSSQRTDICLRVAQKQKNTSCIKAWFCFNLYHPICCILLPEEMTGRLLKNIYIFPPIWGVLFIRRTSLLLLPCYCLIMCFGRLINCFTRRVYALNFNQIFIRIYRV